jgi:AraC-like DNA-binding protein
MAYDVSRLFNQVQALVKAKPRITLAALSTRLGVSRHTMEKAVRAGTGQGYRCWQSGVVAAEAIRLLTESGNRHVRQVAFKLGYESPKAFARFLKGATGRTPSQLRRRRAGPSASSRGRRAA